MKKQLISLIILDGYGLNENELGNAIKMAKTPNMDSYFASYPSTRLHASGMDVGLPEGQMGNSEVGHTNIGAGRIVYQELTRITKAIKDKDFFENEALLQVMENVKKSGAKLHIMGLVSDGGVHSHNTHLYAILEMAKMRGVEKTFVHCFLDGRDVPPNSAAGFIGELEDKIKEIGAGKIATVMGRYFAMDRDNRWDRVEKAYNAMVLGEGEQATDAVSAIEDSYKNNVFDEFVQPTVIAKEGIIEDGDAVIFFNFRPDRAREITRVFVDLAFDGFKKKSSPKLDFVCMTQYDATMPNVKVAYFPQKLNDTFGEYISTKGLKQLRIAETEKYAHVTFFFNGGVEHVYRGEDRALIPSPKVATYDLKPQMSACEVADEVVKRIEADLYDVIILNLANCDMVGHTGIISAAIKAVETVDECVGRVVNAILAKGGIACITADHGNADQMIDPTDGGSFTAHTTNDVPFIVIGKELKLKKGCLADITPTMLDIMGLEKPEAMTGESLIIG